MEGTGGTAGPGRGAGEIGRPGCGARRTRCPWPAGPGRTTSRSADRSSRRGRIAARTAEAGGTDTTASQISHVIYRGHFSRCHKNVAIPTVQIRCLNKSLRNYVRNCWLTAIAGHQGNVLTNISREGPTGAEGAGGAAGPGCGARGPPRAQPGPTAGPGAQTTRGSTSNNQSHTATHSVL